MLQAALLASGIRVRGQRLIRTSGTVMQRPGVRALLAASGAARLYTSAVGVALCAPSVLALLELVRAPSGSAIVQMLIAIIPPVQYACAVQYFACDHFDRFHTAPCAARSNAHVDALLLQPCECSPELVTAVAALGTLSYFVAASFLTAVDGWLLRACLLVTRSYGAFAVLLNSLVVGFVFWKHVKVFTVYVDIFTSQQEWAGSADHHVSVLLRNLVRMKESLQCSTRLLSPTFSSGTALGSAAAGVVCYRALHEAFDVFSYVTVGVFAASQLLFFFVIFRLADAKEQVESVVRSARFADAFLARAPAASSEQRVHETATTIDWFVITHLLQGQWLEFYVLGMPLHSGAFVKQAITVVGAALLVLQQWGVVLGGDE